MIYKRRSSIAKRAPEMTFVEARNHLFFSYSSSNVPRIKEWRKKKKKLSKKAF